MMAEIKHKLVRSETILDILKNTYNANRNNFKQVFENIVLGMTVLTKYNNKTYRISDINFDLTPSSSFDGKNGEKICYRDYYKSVSFQINNIKFNLPIAKITSFISFFFFQKYNLGISTDTQPLLICKPKDKDLRGGRTTLIALIPEFCLATGYTDAMRSNFQ